MTRKIENSIGRDLPHGWRWVELQEAARLVAGASAPQGKDSFSDSGPWFVRVSDLSGCDFDGVVRSTRDRLSELAIATKPLVRVPKGTVVLPKSGAAIATNRRAILGMDAYIVGHLLALIPIPEMILTEWLYFSLRQIDMIEHSENASYPSLKKSAVARITIPLPPRAEQKRLIASLEREIDAVEKARRAALDRVEAARALDSAFLREALEFDDGKLPPGWRWSVLGEVCLEDRRGIDGASSEAAGLPYLSLENVESVSGKIAMEENSSSRGISNCFRFGPEHILYGKLRPYLNKVALPNFHGRCTTELIPLLPKQNIHREFLALLLRQPKTVDWVMHEKTGSRMPRANMKRLMKLEFPLPPLPEQKQIAAALNAKMAIAKQTRAAAEAELEAIEALPGALLRRAFRTT